MTDCDAILNSKESLLINALEKLRKEELIAKQTWKARAYMTVIQQLKNLEKPVTTWEDVKDLKGIGSGIEKKIKEILETGALKRLENHNADGKIKLTNDLMQIHGIGPVKADELIKNGVTSIDDLKTKQDLLNDVQKIGIKYYDNLIERIPRKEMEKHEDYILAVIKNIDNKFEACLTGSFRRKLKDSGDIDVLITHPNPSTNVEELFKAIVSRMQQDGYINDVLASGPKKFMGVCKLKRHKLHRRLDLLYTPKKTYPFALLYFTGSGAFNVKMRNLALSKGYSLSEYGIKYNEGEKKGEFLDLNYTSEKDIFNFLGMKYVEPEDR
jgi:DNA polymerase beta